MRSTMLRAMLASPTCPPCSGGTIVAAISKRPTPRFIGTYHFLSLHPPKNWAGSGFDYRAVLQELDQSLGLLLDGLAREGILDDTVVIVTADHGEELAQERGYQGHGFDVTQALVHTPLFVRLPGGGAEERTDLVSGADVAPTVLASIGVQCDLAMQGRSLLRSPEPDRPVFASSYAPLPAYTPDYRIYSDVHAVLLGDLKLIWDRGEQVFALFDLAADPDERDNRVDARPQEVDRLRALLDGYLAGRAPAALGASETL
jgi:arylsulfatase A-like enzyme